MPLGANLEGLAREIESDRDALRSIMSSPEIAPDRLKTLAARTGEKAGRLKLHGRILSDPPRALFSGA